MKEEKNILFFSNPKELKPFLEDKLKEKREEVFVQYGCKVVNFRKDLIDKIDSAKYTPGLADYKGSELQVLEIFRGSLSVLRTQRGLLDETICIIQIKHPNFCNNVKINTQVIPDELCGKRHKSLYVSIQKSISNLSDINVDTKTNFGKNWLINAKNLLELSDRTSDLIRTMILIAGSDYEEYRNGYKGIDSVKSISKKTRQRLSRKN